jgi:TRAP-type C4-dicarboxylate transport system permease small subunit
MNWRGRALGWLHGLERTLIALLLAALVLGAGLQVFLRAFFDIGVLWLDPLLRALVLWLAMLGALAAARDDRHIAIELLPRYLPESAGRWLRAGVLLFAAGVCGLLAWHSGLLVRMEMAFPQTAFAGVPSWSVMLVMPVGFALLALRLAVRAFLRPVV